MSRDSDCIRAPVVVRVVVVLIAVVVAAGWTCFLCRSVR